jgi:hypothetical protein
VPPDGQVRHVECELIGRFSLFRLHDLTVKVFGATQDWAPCKYPFKSREVVTVAECG